MKRWSLLLLLIPLLLWGAWIVAGGPRLTPEAAVRSAPFVRGEVVQQISFPEGATLLLKDGGTYQAWAACRWALLLWRPCGGTDFDISESPQQPVVESAYATTMGGEGWAISIFTGLVRDERIARIVWAEEEREISDSTRHFVFTRRMPARDPFVRATALSSTGEELYEWSATTFFNWKPVLVNPSASDQSGPAVGYMPVPREQGNWEARGEKSREVAGWFAVPKGVICDCDRVSVHLLERAGEKETYRVHLEGLRDDSIKSIEYLVEVERDGEEWRVKAASFRTECRRGASPDGYCS